MYVRAGDACNRINRNYQTGSLLPAILSFSQAHRVGNESPVFSLSCCTFVFFLVYFLSFLIFSFLLFSFLLCSFLLSLLEGSKDRKWPRPRRS